MEPDKINKSIQELMAKLGPQVPESVKNTTKELLEEVVKSVEDEPTKAKKGFLMKPDDMTDEAKAEAKAAAIVLASHKNKGLASIPDMMMTLKAEHIKVPDKPDVTQAPMVQIMNYINGLDLEGLTALDIINDIHVIFPWSMGHDHWLNSAVEAKMVLANKLKGEAALNHVPETPPPDEGDDNDGFRKKFWEYWTVFTETSGVEPPDYFTVKKEADGGWKISVGVPVPKIGVPYYTAKPYPILGSQHSDGWVLDLIHSVVEKVVSQQTEAMIDKAVSEQIQPMIDQGNSIIENAIKGHALSGPGIPTETHIMKWPDTPDGEAELIAKMGGTPHATFDVSDGKLHSYHLKEGSYYTIDGVHHDFLHTKGVLMHFKQSWKGDAEAKLIAWGLSHLKLAKTVVIHFPGGGSVTLRDLIKNGVAGAKSATAIEKLQEEKEDK